MENLNGIISLLIACTELVLIINLLAFAEKNRVNKLIFLQLFLLFAYQLLEFLICYVGLNTYIFIYLALFLISFLPPLGLYIVLNFWQFDNKLNKFIFLPAVFFVFYFPIVLDELAVTKCTVLYAAYNYPLGDLYGLFYYILIILTVYFLITKIKKSKDIQRQKLSKILVTGYLLTFIPGLIAAVIYPNFIEMIESILCKLSFIIAFSFSLFALKNKNLTETKEE
jgi:hypothetical protein